MYWYLVPQAHHVFEYLVQLVVPFARGYGTTGVVSTAGGGGSLERCFWGLFPSPGSMPTCVLSTMMWTSHITCPPSTRDTAAPTVMASLPSLLSCFRQAFCHNEWEKKPRYKTRMKSTVLVVTRLMYGSWAWLVEKWGRFQSCRQEEHSESTEKMDHCTGSSGGQMPREMKTMNAQLMMSQKGDKNSWRLG